MPFFDLPPPLQERVVCSITAAIKYEIPANLVLAVAERENGKPGQWVKNSNGTHDVGPMQFNTRYLAELSRYGITAADVAQAGCYSYELAAWRLRGHLRNDQGDWWTRAANYHSRTPRYNLMYRADLLIKASQWADWLQARFATYDVPQAGAAPAAFQPVKIQSIPAMVAPAQPRPSVTWNTAGYVPRKLIINDQ